ncbi:hypothetical protein P4S72_03095 [Vibrio sp. PP-XX7]
MDKNGAFYCHDVGTELTQVDVFSQIQEHRQPMLRRQRQGLVIKKAHEIVSAMRF